MAYDFKENENKWNKHWEENGIFKFDKDSTKESFVIDTPPPTVSGSLHIGHIFSYTQTDIQARYNRMLGKNVFYPIGWDDNGLPTERRVQNYFNIACNPTIPYENGFTPVHNPKDKSPRKEISRENFIEACEVLVEDDEKVFENIFRSIGISYDWDYTYTTISPHCRKVSQLSFLDLIAKGKAYNREMPGMWDVTFQSAVAQAEIEDKEVPSKFYDIEFKTEDGESFIVATTRPELLSACIAVVAHPDDERYKHLFGKKAITPAFYAPVPIMPSENAEIDKGTGIMMVCTFGDITDVEFWKQSNLPMKQIISKRGRIIDVNYGTEPFICVNEEKGKANFARLIDLTVKKARAETVAILEENGLIKGEKEITHAVKFYEKGDLPIEFIPSRQWFVDILNHKEDFLRLGRDINWHPEFMKTRYENWVEGLNQDWCISRQRFFGVPFPVWYKLDDQGNPDYENPIFATKEMLPIDPMADTPTGFDESQRGQPNGFMGDPDIMDTWATSSVTPQIMSHWGIDDERHQKLFPMDLRPQAHDIIRTWAFYTIVKAYFHEGVAPWKNIALSGFIVDPDRKKMSKSKGNVVTPEEFIIKHSADAVRYWAGRAKLGHDTIMDESVFQIGKKLATKLYNAGNFVRTILDNAGQDYASLQSSDITELADIAQIEKLKALIDVATKSFNEMDYSTALIQTEENFWRFCDYYIELVKPRAYGDADTPARKSALAGLLFGFKTFLKLFAPFMSYVCEEVYKGFFPNEKSIHTSSWANSDELQTKAPEIATNGVIDLMENLISEIRGAKTKAQRNMRWGVDALEITTSAENITKLEKVMGDIILAGSVNSDNITMIASSEEQLLVNVTLAEEQTQA